MPRMSQKSPHKSKPVPYLRRYTKGNLQEKKLYTEMKFFLRSKIDYGKSRPETVFFYFLLILQSNLKKAGFPQLGKPPSSENEIVLSFPEVSSPFLSRQEKLFRLEVAGLGLGDGFIGKRRWRWLFVPVKA